MAHECVTHHNACDCQEAEHLFQIERRDMEITTLTEAKIFWAERCTEVEMRLAALQVKVDAAITIDVEPDAWASKINFIGPEYKQVPLKKSLNPMNDTHEKLYLERTVIGLMKAAKYDGYTEREEELRRMKETK